MEFSVVSTGFLLLLLGIGDFGRALYTYHAISDAAREATRYAIVRGANCTTFGSACPASATDIQSYVQNLTPGLSASSTTVTTTWTPDNKPGSTVQVKVQYAFKFITPFIHSASVNMSSTSQMVISE
jgi:Flp pilus assembly protein TadG